MSDFPIQSERAVPAGLAIVLVPFLAPGAAVVVDDTVLIPECTPVSEQTGLAEAALVLADSTSANKVS